MLMLRGPQTPGELLQRTERLHHFAGSPELHEVLDGLIERELRAPSSTRRPGQRRSATRTCSAGGPEEARAAAPAAASPAAAVATTGWTGSSARSPTCAPSSRNLREAIGAGG